MGDNEEEERFEEASDQNMAIVQTLRLQIEQQQKQHELQMKQQLQILEQQLNLSRLSQHNNSPQVAQFDISHKEQWEDWVLMFQRSEFYKTATNDQEKIDRLVIAMGVCGQIELRKCCLTSEDSKKYDKVVEALTTHFMGTKTVVYWRYLFHSRVQGPDEPTEQFVADVRNLVVRCKFKEVTDIESELARDRLVCGMRDQQLREALLADSKLSLDRVLTKIRAREQSRRENLSIINASPAKSAAETQQAVAIENVSRSTKQPFGNQKSRFPPNRSSSSLRSPAQASINTNRCFNCGASNYTSAHRQNCPARSARCTSCTNLGHYAKCCRKSRNGGRINSVVADPIPSQANEIVGDTSSSDDDNYFYIDAIYQKQAGSNKHQFIGRIQFNGQIINAKFDSGAEVSVLPPHLVPLGFHISPTQRKLCGAGQSPLDVMGSVRIPLANKRRRMIEEFYVVRQQRRMLIGAPAIAELEILTMDPWSNIDEVKTSEVERNIITSYPKLFAKRLGAIPYSYNIELDKDAIPYSIPIARNVAIPLKEAVNKELRRMIDEGVIAKVNHPTPWCAPMVVVRKKNGAVRICTDFSQLNRFVRRPRIVLPDVETSLAEVGRAKIFSKLDAASGFWQVKLHRDCRDLTTFMTPIGRYHYRRLPFGITSAPEFFQAAMSDLLKELDGVTCHMDDVLVYGHDREQHDRRLRAVLKRMSDVGLVLNREKCVFATKEVRFLGQIISGEFVHADPDRIKAIADFPRPSTVKGVRRLLGSLNQLSKFVPGLAEMTEPIRALLRKDVILTWDQPQQRALDQIIAAIRQTSELIRYDVNASTAVVSDASNKGLGAVLLQTDRSGQWRPVSFGSRTLIAAEHNYAPIEKEALAVTWAVEKFRCFLDGKAFEILTDHQPLVSIFGRKDLSQVPLRIQRFKMRLLPFVFSIRHVPGRDLHTADFLSRHPLPYSESDQRKAAEVEAFVHAINEKSSPVSATRREQVRDTQQGDTQCTLLRRMIQEGWPKHCNRIPTLIREWIPYRNELVIIDELLLWRNCLVIPTEMRKPIMTLLHEGHLGIVRCLARARATVFWPSLTADLTKLIEDCETCRIHQNQRRAPLIHHEGQEEAWQKVGTDIFFINNRTYVIIVDYFSGYFEVTLVANMTAEVVIKVFKEIFGRLGIPQTLVSDAGTQFSSAEWREFARTYGFNHVMSSPYHHQSNGAAERAVQTAKKLIEKNEDLHLALLAYRSSPNSSGYSPAELMMGRRIRSRVPFTARLMQTDDFSKFREWRTRYQAASKQTYDMRHQVKEPNIFVPGERVYVQDLKAYATIERAADTPRSWVLKADTGRTIRRNQQAIVKLAGAENNTSAPNSDPYVLDLPDSTDEGPEDKQAFISEHPEVTTDLTATSGDKRPNNDRPNHGRQQECVPRNELDRDDLPIAIRRARRTIRQPRRYQKTNSPSPFRRPPASSSSQRGRSSSSRRGRSSSSRRGRSSSSRRGRSSSSRRGRQS